MRNILLQKDRERLHKEYKFRKLVLVLVFVFITTLIAILLLIPSYVASEYKESNALTYASIINESIKVQEINITTSVLNDTNIKLQLLSSNKDEESFGNTVKTIIKNKSDGIKIDGFFYTKKDKDKDEIRITGVASHRSVLLRFQKDLENEDIFSDIVLPTSNLASDKDIKFSIKAISKF